MLNVDLDISKEVERQMNAKVASLAICIVLAGSAAALAQTSADFVFGDPVRPDTFVIQLTDPQKI